VRPHRHAHRPCGRCRRGSAYGHEGPEGQLLAISENDTLFDLIGTTYGGDGESTFALPDLRGRIPVHQGSGVILAETGGAEEITLTANQIRRNRIRFRARTTPRPRLIRELRGLRLRPVRRRARSRRAGS
jgi:hypothetical protein